MVVMKRCGTNNASLLGEFFSTLSVREVDAGAVGSYRNHARGFSIFLPGSHMRRFVLFLFFRSAFFSGALDLPLPFKRFRLTFLLLISSPMPTRMRIEVDNHHCGLCSIYIYITAFLSTSCSTKRHLFWNGTAANVNAFY